MMWPKVTHWIKWKLIKKTPLALLTEGDDAKYAAGHCSS